jgi:hypothetical protein
MLDFGTGNGQFYESFAKLRRTEARFRIFAPNFRGLRLNLLRTVAHHLTALIQGSSYLEWTRKAFWKLRKSALEPIAPAQGDGDASKSHTTVLLSERH